MAGNENSIITPLKNKNIGKLAAHL